jgi:ATP-dependent Zn protease
VHITSVEKDDWFVLCSDGMLEQMSNDELVSILTSKTSGEEKRQKLIEATKGNQDNHTAWLIHIRSVEYEEADRELVNEELTSRCNALKILPRPNNNDNLQIADEDDVVVVSRPKPSKKKRPLQQMVFTTLAFLFALMIIWFIFLRNTEKETAPKEEPLMQLPVKPSNKKDNTKDSINKDSTRKKKNESTGNQQPVNAPRRNDTQRHLQN